MSPGSALPVAALSFLKAVQEKARAGNLPSGQSG